MNRTDRAVRELVTMENLGEARETLASRIESGEWWTFVSKDLKFHRVVGLIEAYLDTQFDFYHCVTDVGEVRIWTCPKEENTRRAKIKRLLGDSVNDKQDIFYFIPPGDRESIESFIRTLAKRGKILTSVIGVYEDQEGRGQDDCDSE